MAYDIIFISGEIYFDHPLCGIAILKRLLEKNGYSVGIIEQPKNADDIKKLGKPNLYFAISSGSIDSMVRNYTPLKKLRQDDKNLNYNESVPDRAVIVYSNWVKQHYKDSIIVIGGTEATLRRFVHYDYWKNSLRRPVLFDSRADVLSYGQGEKQTLEIARRIKEGEDLFGIEGTCVIAKEVPDKFTELPSFDEVKDSKEKFCDMQLLLTNYKNLAQKIDNRYVLQFESPEYTSEDLDSYYEMPFTREIPEQFRHLSGFQFSVVTHRGCIGNCNYCSLKLTSGDKIVSRSEESILKEIKKITKHKDFRGNIDDLTAPSADMYGMDCNLCKNDCIDCKKLDRSNSRLISLLKKARKIPGVNKVHIRSGVRYDLATEPLIKEIAQHHVFGALKIAPEHTNKMVLKCMNKDRGDFRDFVRKFKKYNPRQEIYYYFITAHPGSSMKEAKELAQELKNLENTDAVQIFTPTPMSYSTCMYHTGLDPKTKKKVYVPYSYKEKKDQKRVIFGNQNDDSRENKFSRNKYTEKRKDRREYAKDRRGPRKNFKRGRR